MPCRACGARVEPAVDLGLHPAKGRFPHPGEPPEPLLPLRLGTCPACGLVQLADPSPAQLDEPGVPSPLSSNTMAAHARRFVDDLVERGLASPSQRILSLASHGGHLEPFLRERGSSATVVERPLWIPSAPAGAYDLVVDSYLLAHLEDPRAALARLAILLAPGGTLALEFDDLTATLESGQWDAIGHGHPTYLSMSWLRSEFAALGLEVVDATRQPVYGGAIRLFARHGRGSDQAVEALLARDAAARADRPAGLEPLALALQRARRDVVAHLQAARAAGRRVVGYGAPSRAITFLNALGIGPELLPGIADRAAAKQGRIVPGVAIPIHAPEVLVAEPPDEVLVLTWNLVAEVRASLLPVVGAGARLLVAIPHLEDVTEAPDDGPAPGERSVR